MMAIRVANQTVEDDVLGQLSLCTPRTSLCFEHILQGPKDVHQVVVRLSETLVRIVGPGPTE